MFQKERQRRHVAGSVRSATPEPAGSPPSPGLMGTPKHGQPGPTRRPLGMVVVLLALLTAVSLPRTGQATLRCHICEEENNFNCTGPQTCSAADQFCILAAIQIFERFYITTKQCTKKCSVPPYSPPVPEERFGAGLPQPKNFVAQKPLPISYLKCCKWDLCNEHGPHVFYFKEQPGKASERRHRYTELFLPGFMVLIATGLTDLSLQ
ncbi:lymphocyte antigen 6K-like isoform X1 [Onychomys torridus]|uniref:lymphocyte antigen 6K-like isoform X1 n=1 Tax=Onychomys torridus TaxID=38674 RepID=UPI00167F333B|nr:lymphocyte antigen 6K-like isoform X1 [Onychomys torridus]